MKINPTLCVCGCGQFTSGRLWKGLPVRYIRGHGPHYAHPPIRRASNSELLADLQRLESLLYRIPTQADVKLYGKYSISTYYTHFDNWRSALKAANLSTCPNWSISTLQPEDGGWLAGFIAGEGCFQIRKTRRSISSALTIRLRRDDECALQEIKTLWSLENRFYETSNSRCLDLTIADIETCFHKVVPTFDLYTLRGKKGQDFQIWRAGVILLHEFSITHPHHSQMPDFLRNDLTQLRSALQEIKLFQANFSQILDKHQVLHLVTKLKQLRFDPTTAIVT